MPTKITLIDGREYLEYSIQEIERARLDSFVRNSHRWSNEYKASLNPTLAQEQNFPRPTKHPKKLNINNKHKQQTNPTPCHLTITHTSLTQD